MYPVYRTTVYKSKYRTVPYGGLHRKKKTYTYIYGNAVSLRHEITSVGQDMNSTCMDKRLMVTFVYIRLTHIWLTFPTELCVPTSGLFKYWNSKRRYDRQIDVNRPFKSCFQITSDTVHNEMGKWLRSVEGLNVMIYFFFITISITWKSFFKS